VCLLKIFQRIVNKNKYPKTSKNVNGNTFIKKSRHENKTMFRTFFRVLQTNQGFYFNFNNFKKNDYFLNSLKNTIFSGLKYT